MLKHMTDLETLIFPTVHLNGTGGSALRNQADAARHALANAIAALREMAPHGRDYYTQDSKINGDAYIKAQSQHEARLISLTNISNELVDIYNNIDGQIYSRAVDKMFIK